MTLEKSMFGRVGVLGIVTFFFPQFYPQYLFSPEQNLQLFCVLNCTLNYFGEGPTTGGLVSRLLGQQQFLKADLGLF